jgi:hypothetical protein
LGKNAIFIALVLSGTLGIHRAWEIDLQEKGGELHEEDSNGVDTCDRNAVQHSICGRF